MRAAALLLAICLLTACGPDEGNGPWSDGAEQAAAGDTIGATGSACPLPVQLAIAKDWKAKAVPAGSYTVGGAQLACEVDAKPAGHIGFLRVYVTPGAVEPKAELAKVVAEAKQAKEVQYRDMASGGVEVTYTADLSGDQVRRRAYAKPVFGRTVVVTLDAFDNEEYDAMVGAYVLAQHTTR